MHKKRRTARLPVKIHEGESSKSMQDLLVAEEPLTIMWQPMDGDSQKLTATMRTPGHDNELAAGILYAEGILQHKGEIVKISFCGSGGHNELNKLKTVLRLNKSEIMARLSHRPFHPSEVQPQSSCGMCSHDELPGLAGLIDWAAKKWSQNQDTFLPDQKLLVQALAVLQKEAPLFAATGASHAVLLIDPNGKMLACAEDVGRHNACDKAIGELLLAQKVREPFTLPKGCGILFSSRLSFELAAKAVRAGASWMASVGAPTDLAIELAQKVKLPAIGFLKADRYNVYVP